MKKDFSLLFCLATLLSCQQSLVSSTSDLSSSFAKSYNLTLLALQFLTVEMKNDEGEWPENESDYIRAFGDSAKLVLSEFDNLEFQNWTDSLVISYSLKESNRYVEHESNLKFIDDPHLNLDSFKYKLEGSIQQVNNTKFFKPNEGRIVFYKKDNYPISFIHKYAEGVVTIEITHAQK